MVASHRLVAFVGGALVAALCGTLAVLSLTAALIALPAGDTIDQLRKREDVPADRIRLAAQASFRAGKIFETGRYLSDAALAARQLSPRDRAAALDGTPVLTVIDQSLAAAPISPQNWARRAALKLAAHDYPAAQGALETSILLGRYVPGLTVPRLRIILALLQHRPDPDMESYFTDQVQIAARSEPAELAAFADKGAAEGRTQRALYADFVPYSAYLKELLQLRAQAAVNAKPAP